MKKKKIVVKNNKKLARRLQPIGRGKNQFFIGDPRFGPDQQRPPKRRKKVAKPRLLKKPRRSYKSLELALKAETRRIADFQKRIIKAENEVIDRDAHIHQLHLRIGQKEIATWKTGTGEMIPVTQMDEGHLRNAISYCARRLLGQHPGLGDAVYLDNMTRYIEGLANLMKEAKRRGFRV